MFKKDHVKHAKRTTAYFLTGLSYVIVAGITFGVITNAIGIQFQSDLASLINAFTEPNGMGIAIGLLFFVILGFYVWLFAKVGIWFRRLLGEKEQIKIGKRPFVATMFATGILASFIFLGIGQILSGINPNADITNVNTLWDAIIQMNVGLILVVFIGFAIIGWAITKIGRAIPSVDKHVPDSVKKI